VPTGKAARGSVGWAVATIGLFYVLVSIVGSGSRAVLGAGGEKLAGDGATWRRPTWRSRSAVAPAPLAATCSSP
jgi:cation/acetate symporter